MMIAHGLYGLDTDDILYQNKFQTLNNNKTK